MLFTPASGEGSISWARVHILSKLKPR